MGLTSFDILLNHLRLSAGYSFFRSLRLQFAARVTGTPGVESSLERVALPSEEVVSVLSMAGAKMISQKSLESEMI